MIFKFQDLMVPSTFSDADNKNSAKDFEVTWNFPNCLGALDGIHVLMQFPSNTGSSFYN